MKKILLTSLFLVGCASTSFSWAANDSCTGSVSYDRFTCHVENICKTGEWYQKTSLLSKVETPPYLKAEDISKNIDKYFASLDKIGIKKQNVLSELGKNTIDITASDTSLFGPIDAFDLSRLAYRETMNNIYKCAILNFRLATGDRILDTTLNEKSAMKKRITSEKKQITQQMTKYGCRQIPKGQDPSIKSEILNNTTYQECVYRFYMEDYLVSEYKNNFSAFLKSPQKKGKELMPTKLFNSLGSVERLTNFFGNKISQVNQEVNYTRRVYKQAFVSYNEFERTYEMHLWLSFIFEDYINLRDNLKCLLNPIGQVIYKISNAQSPGK